jgi:hypothetical protein
VPLGVGLYAFALYLVPWCSKQKCFENTLRNPNSSAQKFKKTQVLRYLAKHLGVGTFMNWEIRVVVSIVLHSPELSDVAPELLVSVLT